MEPYREFSVLGWVLIVLGLLFVALPYIVRIVPSVERLPWFILWVYRRDGFYFATSPLLMLLSVLSIVWSYLRR
ncbi:MAG TPA: hypothetical protein VMW03_10165 [Candidatus Krumholzibacteriaceae bacterium]|nr:hypothetical protein [Candidatus Krumholzibacteriaceae bacterium]